MVLVNLSELREYICKHLDEAVESTDLTGRVCVFCNGVIHHYESAYEIFAFVVCRHCMARFEADSHRATNMKKFSDDTATEFRKAIQDFKRRIM